MDDLKTKPFTSESFPVAKMSLQKMLEDGDITDVEREEP